MFRVRAVATGVAGAPYYLTFYAANTALSAQDVSNTFATMLVAGRGLQTSLLTTRMEPTVLTIDSTTGQPVGAQAVATGTGINGSSGSPPLPLQVQLGVNLRTPTYTGGRNIQGHFSLPGMTEELNETGVGPNSTTAAYGEFRDALAQTAGDPNLQWVVFSRKNGTVADVTSATINPRWFTLRTRLS